jgi:hypothetical protein
VNVEFYTGVGTTLEMPVMLAPVPNAIDFSDKKILIADEPASGLDPRPPRQSWMHCVPAPTRVPPCCS